METISAIDSIDREKCIDALKRCFNLPDNAQQITLTTNIEQEDYGLWYIQTISYFMWRGHDTAWKQYYEVDLPRSRQKWSPDLCE